MDIGTIYPHEPKNDWKGALNALQEMINRHHVTLISIGNGTASRETEKLVSELTRSAPQTRYLIVNEAGASVYSASALARQEFPDTSAYTDPEITVRIRKAHHAGLIVTSPDGDRVARLLDEYTQRFYADFHTSAPPLESATE